MNPAQRADAADSRDLQRKALDRWERQKKVWNRMEETLSSRRQSSGLPGGAATTSRTAGISSMKTASQYREKVEDLGLLELSVPSAARGGYASWESGLRYGGPRLVPVGRGCYPYPLFAREGGLGEASLTRVVAGEEGVSPSVLGASRQQAKESFLPHADHTQHQYGSRLTSEAVEAEADLLLTNAEQAEYYRRQLEEHGSYVKQQLNHFLLPRSFLEVEGQAVPLRETPPHSFRGEEPPREPVLHYEPRTVALSVPASRPGTGVSHGRREVKDTGYSEEEATHLLEEQYENAYEGERDVLEVEQLSPQLHLSAGSVYFHGRPGELLHGTLQVTNTGTVALFYNWVAVDLLEESAEEAAADGRDPLLEGGIHGMARHTQQGRDYFHLSSPMSGCFLPDEVQHFFFSVCAPISGRFKQTLELLTVPAVSGATRTVIELIALIDPVEPCASQAAVGVGKSMTTKLEQRAAEDAARKTLSASEEQEGAALRSAIQAMEAARDGPKRAVEAHHAESRAVWEKENTFPADGLPYNREVFDTLQQIHHNLRDTIASLGGREIPREWAGDLVQYSLDINLLRDNPTKSVLREAVDVLLRAARVSEREEEPLNELLPRAARALALYEQQRLTPGVQEELTTGQLLHEVPTEEPAPPKEKEKGGARPTSSAGKTAKTAGGKVPPTTPAVAPVLGSLRHQRKEQVFAQLSAEERRLLEDESDLLLARWETSMEATREEQTADYLRHFRHVLAAVQLPLLEVMTHYRREDLKDIQTFADIKVNPATETVTSPPTRSSSKKR